MARLHVRLLIEDDAGSPVVEASLQQQVSLDPVTELIGCAWLLYTLTRDAETEVRKQVSPWARPNRPQEVQQ